jgi:hypothetical protein
MAFRVLIAGGRYFTDYPLLRATLDALLANRLPDVELLTAFCGESFCCPRLRKAPRGGKPNSSSPPAARDLLLCPATEVVPGEAG